MSTELRTIPLDQFRAEVKAQGVPIEHVAFRCPACRTVQSAADLIAAGAGADLDAVERYLAFSCVGRWLNAGAQRAKADGKPCNWTLGGLFQIHELEVVAPDGERHPRFELATQEEAQAHMRQREAA